MSISTQINHSSSLWKISPNIGQSCSQSSELIDMWYGLHIHLMIKQLEFFESPICIFNREPHLSYCSIDVGFLWLELWTSSHGCRDRWCDLDAHIDLGIGPLEGQSGYTISQTHWAQACSIIIAEISIKEQRSTKTIRIGDESINSKAQGFRSVFGSTFSS